MKKLHENGTPWLVIRHIAHEDIGTLATVLRQAEIRYRYHDAFRGDAVPRSVAGCGGLIVMGGPMGVYETDRYPFLADEMRLIRQAGEANLPVLGICLGAQLIAGALGARVYPGPQKEIGWYPVESTAPDDELLKGLPSQFMGFHWHGDTFDLPAGAVRLFRSRWYENQGFRCGRNVCGLQFHPEVTAAMVADWLRDPGCLAEIATVPGVNAATILEQTAQHAAQLKQFGEQLFQRFLSLTVPA